MASIKSPTSFDLSVDFVETSFLNLKSAHTIFVKIYDTSTKLTRYCLKASNVLFSKSE